MRGFIVTAVIALLTVTRSVDARPGEHTVRGALVGTALGFLIGHHVDDIDTRVAVPVLGLMGAAVGHEQDRQEAWRARRARQWEMEGYGQRWQTPAPPPPSAAGIVAPAAGSGVDRHPGVELIKVSIVDDRGVNRDIPIIRMATGFIGPKGERYSSLPTEKQLTERYGQTRKQE